MLRRLLLKDFVIVSSLEIELDAGFTVLSGETGAGKSILLDAMQLALGGRGDAIVVREGAARAEIVAEFDAPESLRCWLDDAGFDAEAEALLLRRLIDAQGRSRAWINGGAATLSQLREAADHLVDIHGQHAWQRLTQPAAVRELLDRQAGVDAGAIASAWRNWRAARQASADARLHAEDAQRERERLAWQIAEIDRLAPEENEWEAMNAEHQRLANAQALIDAGSAAIQALDDGEANAGGLAARAVDALTAVASFDARLAPIAESLESARLQIEDAARTLRAWLGHADLDPQRLAQLDSRLSAWMALARRFRRPPSELAALRALWQDELAALDARADLDVLRAAEADALGRWRALADAASRARAHAAPRFAEAVSQAMQPLGMAGGRFEVTLLPEAEPQSHGLESAELRVAGHPGAAPRPLARVASGGELSRLALAIAVTGAGRRVGAGDTGDTGDASGVGTLIFDEIDAGIGGSVADTVGRLMKRLGTARQVLAVTHLPQVAACADHHFVVAKRSGHGVTTSEIAVATGETRVAEIARMLGGERLSGAGRAHAMEMLADAANTASQKP